MAEDYLAIAERMPADMQTIYMRGFPAHMNMDTIRNFFLQNSGRCTFAFHKKSQDGVNLFLALRFDEPGVAEEVLRRYHDRHILGYRINMKYFKDHKQAREIADDHRRERREQQRPRDRNRDSDRASRRGNQNNRLDSDLRSDLNRERNRSQHNDNSSRRQDHRHRPQFDERSLSREDHHQPMRRSNSFEHNDRDMTAHSDGYPPSFEEDDERYHRGFENGSDEERGHQVHPPRSPSYSPPPPASPDRQPSSDGKESPRKSRSRSPKNRHHKRHHHHSYRESSRSRSHSRDKRPKFDEKDAKQSLPSANKNETNGSIEAVKAIESPLSPQPLVSNSVLSVQASECAESLTNKQVNATVQDKESGNKEVTSVAADSNTPLTASEKEAVVVKKIEAVKKYQEQCETIASVANMFMREDPTASTVIQSCMNACLRHLADDTIKELDEFVKHIKPL